MTTYIIGDIHGHYDQFIELLYHANLVNDQLAWVGGDATLCVMGDYVDRGPNGIGTIDLIMQLQKQVPGQVHALLGNHEVAFLAAYRFGDQRDTEPFFLNWLDMGGVLEDMQYVTPEHIDWLSHLPAMLLVNGRLLIHADSAFYTAYGASVESVNENIMTILTSERSAEWGVLFRRFRQKYEFLPFNWEGEKQLYGVQRAKAFLTIYGGEQIIHGHLPVFRLTEQAPEDVTEPYIYADGLCVDVDAGIYKGGKGFIFQW